MAEEARELELGDGLPKGEAPRALRPVSEMIECVFLA